ncbi:alpha/beta fold hydrolase [Vacuolonema iberomarrocanum]|uniref:alpha/beta fold hydrolase n=1 Tax=Vacuolonema iberomarrocanum TaxID=3454632 RepID=UPI0019EC11C8|nr:alpha/beta hydrolase [filamentous cyanobacterium LEGE 07170]
MTTQALARKAPDALWLSVSPSFQRLDQPLLTCLASHSQVGYWSYNQTPDEPSSLAVALTLLHDYVKGSDRPLHLLGHSTGGLLGLLYARKYPQRVKSLTLLAVGVNPAVDWKAHYYTQLDRLPCRRTIILAQMAQALFGQQPQHLVKMWIEMLEQDLLQSLSLHSLTERFSLYPQGVPVPLLVCGSRDDVIVDPVQLQSWQPWLKPGDRLWFAPGGRHFFHSDHFDGVAREVLDFWEMEPNGAIAPWPLGSSYLSTNQYDSFL